MGISKKKKEGKDYILGNEKKICKKDIDVRKKSLFTLGLIGWWM